ncbi:MAG: ribosome small subunit-dependent GTPase A [Vampirovibrionia bacterium]
MNLKQSGFNAFFRKHYEECQLNNISVGRICAEYKENYKLFSESGELQAVISGKFRNNCKNRQDYPAVGDWVLFDLIIAENKAIIQSILPRISKFSRKVAGKETQEQVIASNVDFAFIVCSLNYDFNLRRIERYLSLVWQSGAVPVVILTKADLCDNIAEKLIDVENIAFGVDIHAVSNVSKAGIESLYRYFDNNKTVVLLGSSGAGKSSLINNIAKQDIMKVNNLRNNIDKGRHTTTHKQMILLPSGGLIIDTPGIRELQLWDAQEGISQTFNDIEKLALSCKFTDCTHTNEPGCAVLTAINDDLLDVKRLENYQKVIKEQAYLLNRQTQSAAKVEKDKWKSIHKQIKSLYKSEQ